MKKIITIIIFISLLLLPFFPSSALGAATDNIANPQIYSQPVIRWGNSSYHDLLGARDPFVVKDNGTYYLYYDCTENLLNPSFESNLGANGWDTWHAGASSTTERKLFGERSLKVETDGTSGGGAYTGNYYYSNDYTEANLAQPTGMLVTPNTTYIASAYFWADSNTSMGLVVKQYKSDPNKFGENVIDSASASIIKKGNNNWQSIFVKFTTASNAKAVTISFASPTGSRTTSYWDGVQLERVTSESISAPSEFPASLDFNRSLEETIGWKSCVATSSNGINFTKKGPLKVLGAKGNWERESETAGFSGTSFMYANVFPYNNKWYAYTWEAWHPVDRSVLYWDLATQLPNGDGSSRYPARSGLSVADSPLGPFTRIAQNSPVVVPTDQNYCQQQIRSCSGGNMVWGCDYITANGVPHQINGQWVLFLAGQTQYQNGVWAGTGGYWGNPADPNNPEAGCHAITSGYATSSSPLGPWTPWSSNPLFTPRDQVTKLGTAEEGPIYYFDRGSGNHVMFYNAISGGYSRVDAFWTKNPLNRWPGENRAQVITQYSNLPWIKVGEVAGDNRKKDVAINLPTVAESSDSSQLLLYFGIRDGWIETGEAGVGMRGYLFHDISLATLDLPLLTPETSSPASSPADTSEYTATYQVAYDNMPTNWSSLREYTYTGNVKASHTFSSTPGDKFIFVKFKTNKGREEIKQQKVVLVNSSTTTQTPSDTSSPLPSAQNLTAQCGNDGVVTVTWDAISESVGYTIRADAPPYHPVQWAPVTLGVYTSTTHSAPSAGSKDFGADTQGNTSTTYRAQVVQGLKYNLSIQGQRQGEQYPYKGQFAGIDFTCGTANSPLPPAQNLTTQCSSDGVATVTWNSVPESVGYTIRGNAEPFDTWSPDNLGIYNGTPQIAPVVGTRDFGVDTQGNTSTTYKAQVVQGLKYNLSIQGQRQGEAYPYKGQYAGMEFTCSAPTPSPTESPEYTTKYQVAYDNLPDWSSLREYTYTGNVKASHTFSSTPGDKFIFVKFKTNKGREEVRQLKVVLVSPAPSPSATSVAVPSPAEPVPSASASTDIYQCVSDNDCVSVRADNCGCTAGGKATAINKQFVSQWNTDHSGGRCTQVMSDDWTCVDSTPKCSNNKCQLAQSSTAVPTASISGPNNSAAGQAVAFNATVTSSITFGSNIFIAKLNGVVPARISSTDITGFNISNFNCDNAASSNCVWYKVGSSTTSSYAANFTLNTAGNYVVIVDVASGQTACSGNPYVTYPLLAGGLNWSSCGDSSAIYLGVSPR